jgi:hypothetical protein
MPDREDTYIGIDTPAGNRYQCFRCTKEMQRKQRYQSKSFVGRYTSGISHRIARRKVLALLPRDYYDMTFLSFEILVAYTLLPQ